MKQTKIIVADKKISDEDLEKIKNQRMFVSSSVECKVESLFDEETQKKLKALEIIKEKRVEFYWFTLSDSVDEYNEHIKPLYAFPQKYLLTQAEFDTLKEMLL